MKTKTEDTRKERDNLPAEAFTRGCACDFYFFDQGKPAPTNLHAIIFVQIMRMFDNFKRFSDLLSLMLLFPSDN